MRLEDEIKSGFQNEFHKAIVNIIYTHNFLINHLNKSFKENGITRQQYNVLRILRGQYPNSAPISLIKERMLDKMSDASRLVERLEKKNLIHKHISRDDRRSSSVKISSNGLDLLTKLDNISTGLNEKMKILSEKEAKTLNSILDKVREMDT